ncbi:MAG TPA: universal stress protein [Gammaproteobacteria bacterium]|nr:universal stress protein [Gammaproteobacteria bacterium]
MERFKKILFFADPQGTNDTALNRAVDLAERQGARLTVVDVVEAVPAEVGRLLRSWSSEQLARLLHEERAAELESIAERARDRQVRTEVRVLTGTPFLEVIREVLRGGHDLVIKGTTPAPGLDSTDMHLMRKCPVPLWVLKGSYGREPFRILAAVDPGPEEPADLNHKILELAHSLALREGAELHVAHAWQLAGEHILRSGRAHMPTDEVETLMAGVKESHWRWLNELLAHYARRKVRAVPHLLQGNPAAALTDFAAEQEVDLIVMGTVARTGLAGFFIGNTAETVLERADCSLLAVKPDGFRTPVSLAD